MKTASKRIKYRSIWKSCTVVSVLKVYTHVCLGLSECLSPTTIETGPNDMAFAFGLVVGCFNSLAVHSV